MHAAKSSVGGFPSVGNFSRQINADGISVIALFKAGHTSSKDFITSWRTKVFATNL